MVEGRFAVCRSSPLVPPGALSFARPTERGAGGGGAAVYSSGTSRTVTNSVVSSPSLQWNSR